MRLFHAEEYGLSASQTSTHTDLPANIGTIWTINDGTAGMRLQAVALANALAAARQPKTRKPTTTPAKKQKTSDSASQQTDERPKPDGVGGAGADGDAEEGGQGRAGDSEGGGKEGGGEDS